MKQFLHYWFVAVPKLTKAQAFALFYRFIHFTSSEPDPPPEDLEDWDEEMKDVEGDDVV